jgi:MFS transporter, ACS family, glucarate transporter
MQTPAAPLPDAAPPPTRARYGVLAFLCAMATILYLDRNCMSQAQVPMMAEFGWSKTQMGLVQAAFTLAYGLFEIPTGRLGDRYGSRRVLTRIVLWWSAFTVITGCVWSFLYTVEFGPISLIFDTFVLLVLIRFLFGAGEAGAIPNAARVIKIWFPPTERGRMQGFMQASMHVGATAAPMAAAWIIDLANWRWTFYLFGAVGVLWTACFYWWFRDQPAAHSAVNAAEIEIIGTSHVPVQAHEVVPWQEVLTHPNIWLLGLIITMSAYNSYFFFSWYQTYLMQVRDVDNLGAGRLTSLALLGATCGSLFGGWQADRITRLAADRYRARRRLGLIAYGCAAISLFAGVSVDAVWLLGVCCALACLAMFSQLPTWWACTYDVSGKHTGSLFGLLNGVGAIGAMGSQLFFGAFADWRGRQGYEGRDQWDPAFYVSIALLVTAGVLWQFVYPRPAIGEAETSQ